MMRSLQFLVGATGFEPTAFWSRTKRATKLRYAPNGANEGTRTLDPRITNALLYQLSHIGTKLIITDFILFVTMVFKIYLARARY